MPARAAAALLVLLLAGAAGCLQRATDKDEGPDPAFGPCAYLADDAREPLLLVHVRRIKVNTGADLSPVANLQVNVTKGSPGVPFGNDTTDAFGCLVMRLEGEGLYEAIAAQGAGACRARGSAAGLTSGDNHLELTLRLQDPCA